MSNPLAEGFEAGKSVFVTNIDIEVQEAHLKQLFGFCGELAKLKFLSHTLASPFKACLLEFKDASAVETALMLTDTPLLGRVIQVRPSELAEAVPSGNEATDGAVTAVVMPPVVGMPPMMPLLMMPPLMLGNPLMMGVPPPVPMPVLTPAAAAAAAASAAAVAVAPLGAASAGAAAGVQGKFDGPAANQQSPEELMRTVYVGNVSPNVSNADLLRHMGCCGPVTMVRISGSQGHVDPTRYAFIEYTTVEATRLAVERMSGTILAGLPLRVSSAKNPIVKPVLSVEMMAPIDAKRKLKERLRKLHERLTSDRSPRRRDRSRSPRRRDRSRSPRR